MLKTHQRQLKNWFKKTEYVNPNDWQWFKDEKLGIFCWSPSKKVGFTFSLLHGPIKDKCLWLEIENGAEKIE